MSTECYEISLNAMKEAHNKNMEVFKYIIDHLETFAQDSTTFMSELKSLNTNINSNIKPQPESTNSLTKAWDEICSITINRIAGFDQVVQLLQGICYDGLKSISDQYNESFIDIITSIEQAVNNVHYAETIYQKADTNYRAVSAKIANIHERMKDNDSPSLQSEFTTTKLDYAPARDECEEKLRLLNNVRKSFALNMERAMSKFEELDSTRDQRLIALVRRMTSEVKAVADSQHSSAIMLQQAVDSIHSREDNVDDESTLHIVAESQIEFIIPPLTFDIANFA